MKKWQLESEFRPLIKNGATLEEMAVILSCDVQTVRKQIRKMYNVPKDPKGGILTYVRTLWSQESFQASVDRGEIVIPPTGSELKASDCFKDPPPPEIYQSTAGNGLRASYSSVDSMRERNERITASLASGGSGMGSQASSNQQSLPFPNWRPASPFSKFRR